MCLKNKEECFIPVSHSNNDNIYNTFPTSKFDKNKNIIFSFKYLKCCSLKNRNFNNCFTSLHGYATWITLALKKISEYSSMNINEIKGAGKSTRFHPVENKHLDILRNVLIELGVNIDKIFIQNESQNYYELSFGTGNGRMFGYLVENQYYVLLMDPNHLIYKNVSKGAKQDLLYKNYDPWNKLLKDNNVYIN